MNIISFNTCLLPPFIKIHLHSTDKEYRLNLIKNAIKEWEKDIDIICFQEVFSNSFSTYWRDNIHSNIYNKIYSPIPSICKGYFVDSGLMILSKYPVVYSEFQPFNVNPYYLKWAYKGFLYAMIKKDNKILHLFNIHLHSEDGGGSSEECMLIRRKQIQQIQDFIDENIEDKENIIITGDFNIDIYTEEYKNIFSNYKRYQPEKMELYTTHKNLKWCSHTMDLYCDYSLCKGSLDIKDIKVLTEFSETSDHYPVKISFSSS